MKITEWEITKINKRLQASSLVKNVSVSFEKVTWGQLIYAIYRACNGEPFILKVRVYK